MQVEHLSSDYRVSLLSKKDVPKIYQLYQGNPLYFEHMKAQPTLENLSLIHILGTINGR